MVLNEAHGWLLYTTIPSLNYVGKYRQILDRDLASGVPLPSSLAWWTPLHRNDHSHMEQAASWSCGLTDWI